MSMSQLPPPEVLAQMPVQAPPPGVMPNFDNPDSLAPGALAVISIFLALMVITLVARLYCRISIVRRAGLDDWMAAGAGAFGIAVSGVAIDMLLSGGFGPHSWNVPLLVFFTPRWNRDLFMLTLFTPLATGLAKISILLFILRIFPRVASPKTAYATYCGLFLNTAFYTALTIATFVICTPRSGEAGQLPAKCDPRARMNLGIASSAINAALDIYVLAVAIPSLWTLQIATKKKIGVILVLGTGMVACAFSLLSLYLRVHDDPMDDPCRKQVFPLIITTLENLLAITTACLPALPALWASVTSRAASSMRRFFSSFSKTSSISRSKSGFELQSQEENSSTKSLNVRSKITRGSDVESQVPDPYRITVTTSIRNEK